MTIYRATVYDTPRDPFTSVDPSTALTADEDCGLLVRDGVLRHRGAFDAVRAAQPDEEVEDLRGGVLLPGFVDTHVHYPQMRAIGGLGLPLLDWLSEYALPEESRLADTTYADAVAQEFLAGLARNGTTSALVFGSHFASAMQVFFGHAQRSGLNITAGLVLGDRLLRGDLHCTPQDALTQSLELIEQWHGRGRLRYAVTPRFALSASEPILDVCAQLLEQADDIWFTSHANENKVEIATVAELFPDAHSYLDAYARHGLVTSRSVFAHNAHVTDSELELMAGARAWSAHCPTSNSALGSGLFPLRSHLAHGVGVALGSDVGAGTGMFIGKEALQAYFMQQLLGADGMSLTPVHLLYLATRAGACALGLGDHVGDLAPGKQFDAVLIRPAGGSELAINLAAAVSPTDALARIFALATSADVAKVWAAGRLLGPAPEEPTR